MGSAGACFWRIGVELVKAVLTVGAGGWLSGRQLVHVSKIKRIWMERNRAGVAVDMVERCCGLSIRLEMRVRVRLLGDKDPIEQGRSHI